VGYFPSFTAGWIISDEGFYGEAKLVNFMKLRASYGTLGNDQILIMVMFLNFLVKLLMFLMVLWLTEQQTVKYKSNLKWEQAQNLILV
jgi:hypothetical protein